jgi:hypothetical protein
VTGCGALQIEQCEAELLKMVGPQSFPATAAGGVVGGC